MLTRMILGIRTGFFMISFTVNLQFRFNPIVFFDRPGFIGVGTSCFVARHAIDRKYLALPALDQRLVFLDFGSDPVDLIPSDDVAAGVNSAVGFYPVKLIVTEA